MQPGGYGNWVCRIIFPNRSHPGRAVGHRLKNSGKAASPARYIKYQKLSVLDPSSQALFCFQQAKPPETRAAINLSVFESLDRPPVRHDR
jgi:hypothetical protein